MKTWMGVSVVVIVGVVGLGLVVRWWMFRPFYQPGNLAGLTTLEPPGGGQAGFWQVRPEVMLRHFDVGDGPPLLVIHGGPGQPPAAPWSAAQHLAPKHRVHFYHQRGCGDSTRPIHVLLDENTYERMKRVESTLGLGEQIADVERIRRILGEDKLVIVGHSFGAFMAALYAAEFPDHVAALILLSPADLIQLPRSGDDLFALVRSRLPASMTVEYDTYVARTFDFPTLLTLDEAQLSTFFGGFGRFFGAATGTAMPPPNGSGGGWMTLAVYLSMGRQHDYRAALQRVSAPVLVIHGAKDLIPSRDSAQMASFFPHARMEVMDGAGHFMFEDQPEELARRVEAFLAAP